jgi:hypothetical protein
MSKEDLSLEERLARTEANLHRLAVVQDEMMDLLGFTMEGERRLATRMERAEESRAKLEATVQEIGDKLNALIGVVDGLIGRG